MKKEEILKHLLEKGVGRENVISSANFDATEDTHSYQRRQIDQLRREGYPIIGDKEGYFIADDEQEINDYESYMENWNYDKKGTAKLVRKNWENWDRENKKRKG
ncbi:MAG: hypothetical protein FWG70_05395 [Oscillospiraceae bacterium]|nr:hypothetical protein [Oscillospiraceae bacterium]